MTEHPGVIRPRLRNKFSSEKRSKYIIGGYKFGFGFRRRFWNNHITKVLGENSLYTNTDILINSLENAPEPNESKVKIPK